MDDMDLDCREREIVDGAVAEILFAAQTAALQAACEVYDNLDCPRDLGSIAAHEASRVLSQAFPQALMLERDLRASTDLPPELVSRAAARRN